MPAIKVRAVHDGEYDGHFRNAGTEFFLVDRKDPRTGDILQTAEEALCEVPNRAAGVIGSRYGWMERCDLNVKAVDPKVEEERQARIAQEEQDRKAAELAGLDPNDPEVMANLKAGRPQETKAPEPAGKKAGRPKKQANSEAVL